MRSELLNYNNSNNQNNIHEVYVLELSEYHLFDKKARSGWVRYLAPRLLSQTAARQDGSTTKRATSSYSQLSQTPSEQTHSS